MQTHAISKLEEINAAGGICTCGCERRVRVLERVVLESILKLEQTKRHFKSQALKAVREALASAINS